MDTSDILIDAFGRIREDVHRAADGLDAAGLAYRPDADANSIAWLVWHLTRIQDDHVSEIAGRVQMWHNGPWAEQLGFTGDLHDTGFGHTSEQVAAIRPATPASLLGYHDAVADRTIEYLTTVNPDELDRVVDRSFDPPVTVGVRLVSVVNDCMQHAGQAQYVRGLFERQRDE
ncbi:MAG TPA: DUF664 domain-containing protein [Jiangellaceae bacterium]|nr:DUF664 domain-containing protein [Jiangellaceae bacterium]